MNRQATMFVVSVSSFARYLSVEATTRSSESKTDEPINPLVRGTSETSSGAELSVPRPGLANVSLFLVFTINSPSNLRYFSVQQLIPNNK